MDFMVRFYLMLHNVCMLNFMFIFSDNYKLINLKHDYDLLHQLTPFSVANVFTFNHKEKH